MGAAAITLGLNLAATYLPQVILLIKQIRQKDGTVITVATVVSKLDEADADFQDNLNADAAWFAAHGYSADAADVAKGSPAPSPAPATVAVSVDPAAP